MNTLPRDPDQIVATWLDDGPTQLPDDLRRSIAVAARTTPQRRRALVRVPWRFPIMNTYAKLALTAGVVVVVVVGGIALFRPGDSSGPGGATGAAPSVAPSAAPSGAPSPSAPTAVTVRLESRGHVGPPPASISVTVPPGWGTTYGGQAVNRLGIDYEPLLWLWQIDNRFESPCTDHTLLSPAPEGVDELLGVLATQPGITAGGLTSITIDGYSGKYVELTMATDPLTCGSGGEGFWLWASPDGDHFFAGANTTYRVYALDIEGNRFTFFARIPADTTAEDRATLEAIIDTMEIEPATTASPNT